VSFGQLAISPTVLSTTHQAKPMRHLVNLPFHQLFCVNYSSGKTDASFGQLAISPTVLSTTHQAKPMRHLVNLPFHQLFCHLLIRQN
jgi:hypothetical protein